MISVLVVTYNRLDKLKKCLESIFDQDYKDFEVLIIDNGSTDGTIEYLKDISKKRDNLVPINHGQGNVGPARARNIGVEKSRGSIVAFTDDDCLVPPNWLNIFDKSFKENKDLTAVGGYLEASEEILKSNIYAQYEKYHERTSYKISDQSYFSTRRDELPFQTNNIAYSKKDFLSLGGFDVSFGLISGEDGDLKERALKAGMKFLYVPLKVTHIQDYTLSRIWRQSLIRGAGTLEYRRRHNLHVPTIVELYGMYVLVPIRMVLTLAKNPLSPQIALVEGIVQMGRNVGKINYLKRKTYA